MTFFFFSFSHFQALDDWFWKKFFPNNIKIEALKKVTDGESLLERSSVERKLISSLCYDFGKEFPLDFLVNNSSKKRLFCLLWNEMPNLHPFALMLVPHKNRQVSFKAACYDIVSSTIANFRRLRGVKR